MDAKIILLCILLNTYIIIDSIAQEMPFVYDVENTGADCTVPPMLSFEQLPVIKSSPNPFMWADTSRGCITNRTDWRCRRAEIGAEVQHYELGTKPPRPDTLEASFSAADSMLAGQAWYYSGVSQFNNAVAKLPYDHHELMAMVAPRALLVTGNPDYEWLADESGYACSKAAHEVWKALGVPDRFGFSIVGGHMHCQVPSSQIPEIEAFVDKFLLGKDSVNTNISTSPYNSDLAPWITWDTPHLSE